MTDLGTCAAVAAAVAGAIAGAPRVRRRLNGRRGTDTAPRGRKARDAQAGERERAGRSRDRGR